MLYGKCIAITVLPGEAAPQKDACYIGKVIYAARRMYACGDKCQQYDAKKRDILFINDNIC
jgi:hypothetical protein